MGANGGGGATAGGKRKIDDDEIELAKQKAQAIAARFLSDADSKRPRTSAADFSAPPPPPSYASNQSAYPGMEFCAFYLPLSLTVFG